MSNRAYVLIATDISKTADVVAQLRSIPGVIMADTVAGTYDAVAVVEGADPQAVGRLIMNQIHGLPGLRHTHTLVAL